MKPAKELALATNTDVTRIAEIDFSEVQSLLKRYGIEPVLINVGEEIPGSFWGEEEAGLIGSTLYLRPDTPLHSLLHESCHCICMDNKRRSTLHTNAGGTSDEENAVCYLQILLADHFTGFNQAKMMRDMNHWGYNFILGSCEAWFKDDAQDARDWLLKHELINDLGQVSYQLRS